MPISDPTDTVAAIDRLRAEVVALTEQQTKALKDAVYLGMTPDEAKEYDERRKKITCLMNELMLLQESQ